MLKFRTPLCGLPGVYVTSEQQRVRELIFHLQRLLGFHRNSAYGIEALEVKQSARKFQKLSTLLPPKVTGGPKVVANEPKSQTED